MRCTNLKFKLNAPLCSYIKASARSPTDRPDRVSDQSEMSQMLLRGMLLAGAERPRYRRYLAEKTVETDGSADIRTRGTILV